MLSSVNADQCDTGLYSWVDFDLKKLWECKVASPILIMMIIYNIH